MTETENMLEDKREIRRRIRGIRRKMEEEWWREKSRSVCENIQETEAYREAKIVYVYLAVRGEVLLDELIRDALCAGKCVLAPRVKGKEMIFCPLRNLDQVQIGPMGIREPSGQGESGEDESRNPEENVLFLMPGIAFDRKGNRVGQGGGYYDRFLERNFIRNKIGVAFSFQIYEKVPAEERDIPVDAVVTEEGVWPPSDVCMAVRIDNGFTENYEFF